MANHLKIRLEIEESPNLFPKDQLIESSIKNYDKKKKKDINVNLISLRETNKVITGTSNIYGDIYNDLNFDNLLPKNTVFLDLFYFFRLFNTYGHRHNDVKHTLIT